MSPLGKLTLALIGVRFLGLNGLLLGLFFGHMLVDKTLIIPGKYLRETVFEAPPGKRTYLGTCPIKSLNV